MTQGIDEAITAAAARIGSAITAEATPGPDAAGGCIASLTEAVMGITAGLFRVAEALDGIAEAIRDGQDNQ